MTDETARPTDEGAPISTLAAVSANDVSDVSDVTAATDDADHAAVERALRAGLAEFELAPEDEALLGADGPDAVDDQARGPLPVVAVIGRPNVGKSSLVNRILRRREAVVEDVPGVTRDRVSYEGEWAGRRFTIVDTGGWEADATGIHLRVAEQAEIAIELADVVMFVVDATVGSTDDDESVVRLLRKADKPVVLIANKVDDQRGEADAAALWNLGLGQPWRDLRKLLKKESIAPDGSTIVFTAAPTVALSALVLIAAAAPFITTTSPLDGVADLYAVVSLLLVASIALALAGLDTGSAFGGMGSSRTVTVAALAEPTLLVVGFALSARVGSSNLTSLVEHAQSAPGTVLSPTTLLAAVALWIVVVAEAGRLPVDNPSTHLELTMIHEATILEYAGRDLALVELGSALRLAVLLGLWGNLFLPWGVATTAGPGALALGALVFIVKIAALGAVLAASEVFMAKWRLFRVPEMLAGSFLFGVLAVSSSFFLA